jgi:cytochrome c553
MSSQVRRRLGGALAPLMMLSLLLAMSTGMAQQQSGARKSADQKSAAQKSSAQASSAAGGYAQRFAAECAACHGADGRSEMPGTPFLAGQHSYYAITQLFLFREGRRSNEAMTAVAKTMKDADLQGFSDFIGTLPPWPPTAPTEPPDTARMSRGLELAEQKKCLFCHGPDLSGGQQVPRIAGQREDYLRASLQGYRTGKRAGYTQAMIEPLSGLSAEDVDTLAYFVANRRATPKEAGK